MARKVSNYSIRNLSIAYFSSHYHFLLPIWMSHVLSFFITKEQQHIEMEAPAQPVRYCLLAVLQNMTEISPPYYLIRNLGDPVRAVRVLCHWYSSEQDIAQLP